jgi:hypothetical protein
VEKFSPDECENVKFTALPIEEGAREWDVAPTRRLRFPFLAFFTDFFDRKPQLSSRHFFNYERAVESAVKAELLSKGATHEALKSIERKRSYGQRMKDYATLVLKFATPADLEKKKGRRMRSEESKSSKSREHPTALASARGGENMSGKCPKKTAKVSGGDAVGCSGTTGSSNQSNRLPGSNLARRGGKHPKQIPKILTGKSTVLQKKKSLEVCTDFGENGATVTEVRCSTNGSHHLYSIFTRDAERDHWKERASDAKGNWSFVDSAFGDGKAVEARYFRIVWESPESKAGENRTEFLGFNGRNDSPPNKFTSTAPSSSFPLARSSPVESSSSSSSVILKHASKKRRFPAKADGLTKPVVSSKLKASSSTIPESSSRNVGKSVLVDDGRGEYLIARVQKVEAVFASLDEFDSDSDDSPPGKRSGARIKMRYTLLATQGTRHVVKKKIWTKRELEVFGRIAEKFLAGSKQETCAEERPEVVPYPPQVHRPQNPWAVTNAPSTMKQGQMRSKRAGSNDQLSGNPQQHRISAFQSQKRDRSPPPSAKQRQLPSPPPHRSNFSFGDRRSQGPSPPPEHRLRTECSRRDSYFKHSNGRESDDKRLSLRRPEHEERPRHNPPTYSERNDRRDRRGRGE